MFRLFLLSVLFPLFFSCGNPNGPSPETTVEQQQHGNPFSHFSRFPKYQFRDIQLGQTKSEIRRNISSYNMAILAENEVNHYYFPADSTELIIPNTDLPDGFKIFLRGQGYLNRVNQFESFLAENTTEQITHTEYTIFKSYQPEGAFKLTLFKQPDFLRLHFSILLP